MTFEPGRKLTASAVDLHDDDGHTAATLYGRAEGIEIVCDAGYTLEGTTTDRSSGDCRISIRLKPKREAHRR